MTAPWIVNVTATVCFEWKNRTDCAHLTFRVLGSGAQLSDTLNRYAQIPKVIARPSLGLRGNKLGPRRLLWAVKAMG